MEAELIDRIYECGFAPENWPAVLRDVSKISDCAGAALFVTDPEIRAWTASKRALQFTERFVQGQWYWRGELMRRVHAADRPGFIRDIDVMSMPELDQEPIYRGVWGEVGVRHGVATAFMLPQQEYFSIVMPRLAAKGPADPSTIENLDRLRPHLGRAALIAARLRLERARAVSDVLAALGLAALVINSDRRVLAANALIEAAPGVAAWGARDRVALRDKTADRLLGEAVALLNTGDKHAGRSFPVRDVENAALHVAHVIPVRLSARDIFSDNVGVFVLAPVGAQNAPPLELIRSLFDLTPSEARVARGLASGKSVDDLAAESSVSVNTVRVQVRGVLEKTGCHRQVDVVAMLTRVATLLPPERD